jgi:hypothetical protein
VQLDQADTTYLLERGNWFSATQIQRITKPGVTIGSAPGAGERATIYWAGGNYSRWLYVTGERLTLRDVNIAGNNGAAIAKAENAVALAFSDVHQKRHNGQGISLAEIVGSDKAVIDNCTTEWTGWNSVYLSSRGETVRNTGLVMTNCDFGPSKDEHSFRAYGLYGAKLMNCRFDNAGSTLKQAAKFMSGDGVEIVACTFLGSQRNGRDANDASTQTLNNLVFRQCVWKECTWLKFDAGTKVAIFGGTIESTNGTAAIDIAGDARLYIERTAVTGKALVNNPGKVTRGPGVTLNGRAL